MKTLLPILAGTLLAGCAAEQARYPSLLPRAAEKGSFDEPSVTPAAPVVADPQLDSRLAEVAGRLDTSRRGFDGDLTRAERAAALPGVRTVGSEAWLSAQAALAALDDWRAQATGIASELEAMAGERLGAVGTPYPPLDAVQASAAAEVDRGAAATARLGTSVPTP